MRLIENRPAYSGLTSQKNSHDRSKNQRRRLHQLCDTAHRWHQSFFDSSEGHESLQFTLGEGRIIPGLDAHIIDMAPGTKSTVTIPCDQAYSLYRAEAIQTLEHTKIPAGINIE